MSFSIKKPMYGGYINNTNNKSDKDSLEEESSPKKSIRDKISKYADVATVTRLKIIKKDYFASGKRGEIYEWKQQLNSEHELARKETLKKVIAAMFLGKDVSPCFPHVMKCLYTKDLEMKKLVYQYLICYSSKNPEMAVLAINSFCKDCEDKSAMIRALAIRTMASIRVDCISEYLLDPLRRAFKDEVAFVRKSAVIAVAKLFETLPEVAFDFELEKELQKMLNIEINGTVVSAIVSALIDISKITTEYKFKVPIKVLRFLPECNEWGQIAIIDSLNNFNNEDDTSVILEAVLLFLQHSNPALVLSAIKTILLRIRYLPDEGEFYLPKISSSLVSLLDGSNPEISHVTLDFLYKISSEFPLSRLKLSFRMFFCKYNDPICIKLGKLKILPLLVNRENYDSIIVELAECSKEEVDFIIQTQAIKSLTRCSEGVEGGVFPLVVGALSGLIRDGQFLITQSLWISCKELLIRNEDSNNYELLGQFVKTLLKLISESEDYQSANFEDWQEESLMAMIWVLGEFSPLFGLEISENLINCIKHQSLNVHNELLSAKIKLGLEIGPIEDRDLKDRLELIKRTNNLNFSFTKEYLKNRYITNSRSSDLSNLLMASDILAIKIDSLRERMQVAKETDLTISMEALNTLESEEDNSANEEEQYVDSIGDSEIE